MLESLLNQIDRIYGLNLEVSIREFLIGRETCLRLAGVAEGSTVLVQQNDGDEEVRLGVYLGDELLSRLEKLELSTYLSPESLALLCTAIEEVSHFAYLCWNARRGKPVTQLELELQGEVDKFITSVLLLTHQNRGRLSLEILDPLFGDFELREGLDESSRARYRAASSFARNYCFALVRRFLRQARLADLFADLRIFYRLSQVGKIGHIQRAVYSS
jgi:hypothetical protein